ncbi:MAG: nucleotidyltransferase domain-containing protein [Pseudomonadota bacterium]
MSSKTPKRDRVRRAEITAVSQLEPAPARIVQSIADEFGVIALHGSRVSGVWAEDSDYDIAIAGFTADKEGYSKRLSTIALQHNVKIDIWEGANFKSNRKGVLVVCGSSIDHGSIHKDFPLTPEFGLVAQNSEFEIHQTEPDFQLLKTGTRLLIKFNKYSMNIYQRCLTPCRISDLINNIQLDYFFDGSIKEDVLDAINVMIAYGVLKYSIPKP